MSEKFEVFNEDSLKFMANKIKENEIESYDCMFTDPPYNISRDNNFDTMGRSGIDFGEWDKGFDLTNWISDAVKLVKKGGNIVIFNDWKNLGKISETFEDSGCNIKDMLRWIKRNPMPRNRDRRFITDYEVALWAVKSGSSWTFNRLSETFERPEIEGGLTTRTEKEKGSHPTQKPVYVMKWLIERLSNPEDIIFDPFMGSGSTGVACKELNRRFIGIELDNNYYEIAKKRIGIN